MAITLDAATEKRLQQQLATGRFREPAELLAHALDLIEAEEDITARRAVLLARLEESCRQADRGDGYTEEQLRARMVERRASHHFARTA
jgi:Arc/MetJ-type ribon-helix-helix transcriptional regulator